MTAASPLRIGVVVFPGINTDGDTHHALETFPGVTAEYLWHKDTDLKGVDGIVIPGGFSYGDYLRCGAIARFSPIMQSITDFAADGGLVMGICNGFQILIEAGLLPGGLIRNTGPQVRLQVRQPARRDGGHAVHQRLRRRATCCASSSSTTRATTRSTRRPSRR